MCEESDRENWNASGLTRRNFTAIGGAVALTACAGMAKEEAEQAGLVETSVLIETEDGTDDAFFVHPANGAHPAVIIWPDIAGLREVKKAMARRLADQGYAVLVTNPYYRDAPAPQFAEFSAIMAKGFESVKPWRDKLTADAIMRDATALVAWLDGQDAVDTSRGIGTQGYCMGGPFTVWSAAAVPNRIKAAASFHGGGLVVPDEPNSPDKLIAETQASFLFAIAQNDDAKEPEAKFALTAAAQSAERPARIEVFPADHGWAVPGLPVYDKEQAERAWQMLLALYSDAL